jgi:hypothetical protein
MKLTQDETLRLAARFALHLLHKNQHDMGTFGGSADCCNLWELLAAGLGNTDPHPQVPMDEIIERVQQMLGPEVQREREITLDEVWDRR